MIIARHTWFHVRFFRWYSNCRIRRNFSSVSVHGTLPEDSRKSLLIIANHFSWWDGFFILWLNTHYLKKQFHVMMLEDQLRKNRILNKTGAFSIKKGSRDMIESLRYARSILCGKASAPSRTGPSEKTAPLLLMYPQGEIQSMHTQPLVFEKGIEHITHGLEGKLDILMVVVLIDYFSSQKPHLHFYAGYYPFDHELNSKDLESAYNVFFSESINYQVNHLTQTGTSSH